MAKKNIITDFNSLKGQLTFSENCSVAVPDTGRDASCFSHGKVSDSCAVAGKNENNGKQETVNGNTFLKVGQKVVMMDSDLRGKIVSLGKNVSIEVEDGFVIQASYGEFAVTCDAEVSALKQSKIKGHSMIGRPAGPSTPGHRQGLRGVMSVDLHIEAIPGGRNIPKGQQLQFQMETFKRVLNENMSHRGLKIEFIHGIGDGVLKTAIRKELDEVLAMRCSYSVGDPAVTVVTIR